MNARPPASRVRLAAALWIVFACVVWNVVFDRTLVLAGRRYSFAAAVSAHQGGPYLKIDDWMRPAIAHGRRVASMVALGIAAGGLAAVWIAARRGRN